MDRFYLVPNDAKDPGLQVTNRIKSLLEEAGRVCILAEKNEHNKICRETIPSGIDCVIVIGGDGSFTEAARLFSDQDIPILGINMGALGYLTEVEVGDVDDAIRRVLDGQYALEDRMMLEGTLKDGQKLVALNDVVISRKAAIRLIRFRLYVNGELLNSYESDGIIIATPTGSTAYNLSAGGPIAKPTASLIVVTPICSHALNTSSIVLSSEDEIVIQMEEGKNGGKEEAAVAFDGENEVTLSTGETLTVRKAPSHTQMMKLNDMSFLELVRRKMKGN